jgi:hypothetical protein
LYKTAAQQKAKCLERERQKREWAEQKRRREILRKQIEEETVRTERLSTQAKLWQESQQIRAYVQAVRSAGYYALPLITAGQKLDEWCALALDQANRMDPTISSFPSVLDYKDQFSWHRRFP